MWLPGVNNATEMMWTEEERTFFKVNYYIFTVAVLSLTKLYYFYLPYTLYTLYDYISFLYTQIALNMRVEL